jgi:glycosyltransferase involved in cell wall biosynthesis
VRKKSTLNIERKMEKVLKITLITNTFSPYRNPVFAEIAKSKGVHFLLISCSRNEPNRHWDLPDINFEYKILHPCVVEWNGRYIHNNPDIIAELKIFKPDVIVTDGFNPTHLYAFFYSRYTKIPHVHMTDGTFVSEKNLNFVHRLLRRYVYAKSEAYIAASDGGYELFDSYHLLRERYFKSCLCIDNEAYSKTVDSNEKRFDLMTCGRLEMVKNPQFVLEVAVTVSRQLQRKIKVLFVGSGGMEKELKRMAALFPDLLDVTFNGHADQRDLPGLYASARIFLFPSVWDPWGVVVNEACAAGLPVIASPFAGASNELVRDEYNGFICELNINLWVKKTIILLTQPSTYDRFSENTRLAIAPYNFDDSANGVVLACQFAKLERDKKMHKKSQQKRAKVLIVERQLLQYRLEFYEGLRKILDEQGIDLQLLVGKGTPAEALKKNEVSLDWALHIPTDYYLRDTLCWQPFGRYAKDADLVIVMQENKLIYNLWLMSFGRPKRLAFWGHGMNMQSPHPNGLKERFKRWSINKVDWWFAYTDSSADIVAKAGFPSQRTTVVDNAVDTEQLSRLCREVSMTDRQKKCQELHLGSGPVALYLGSLYEEKRLDFLLESAHKIRQRIPEFQLLVAGAGSDQSQIEAAAKQYPWIHYLGTVNGNEKAVVLTLADVILNPGLVGLGILDAFAAGKPMFTTDCGLHSPEISYLVSGYNGVMTANDMDAYTDAVCHTLQHPETLLALSKGALSSAPRYTIANMVNLAKTGIQKCLSFSSST